MLKILIVNRALGTLFGGGESFDLNSAFHLKARGHQVTLITGKPIFKKAKLSYSGVDVVYLPSPNLRRFAYMTEKWNTKLSAAFYHLDNAIFERAVLGWYAKQMKGQYDLVQCCSLFWLPRRLLEQHSQPVVSWLPGPPSRRIRNSLSRLISYPNFRLFTHGSPEWPLMGLGFSRGKDYDIVEPGVDLLKVDAVKAAGIDRRRQIGLTHLDLLGVSTARLIPVKNHCMLLNALSKAKQKGVCWNWIFIGDGPLETYLKTYAQELGIAQQIHFLGYQNQSVVHEWLACSDLFVLTSSYENFSIATLEAMAHCLPIIGTQVGYLQYLIANAGAGIVVPVDNPDSLAAALLSMNNAALRSNYGQRGRTFVENLDWSLIGERLESLYQRTITGRRS